MAWTSMDLPSYNIAALRKHDIDDLLRLDFGIWQESGDLPQLDLH